MNTAEEYILEAKLRDLAHKPADVRRQGELPVTLYGKNVEPKSLAVEVKGFKKIFHKAGESSLINLKIAGEDSRFILFKEPVYDPRTNDLMHIDFYQVNLNESIKAEVPLVFVGEAPALTTYEAILVTNKDHVEVECLPRDLPHEIQVDLSVLKEIDDTILVKDLSVASGVEILDDAEESIVLVAHQAVEEVAPVEVSESEAVASVEVTTEKTDAEAES